MYFQLLKQIFSNDDEPENSKLQLMYLVVESAQDVSLDDLFNLFPRCCQNFIALKTVTKCLAFRQFRSSFISEDSEGAKVYLKAKENCLPDKLIAKAYNYLVQNGITVTENLFDGPNQLIIYEKTHENNPFNHYQILLHQEPGFEILLCEGFKKYLFAFTQDRKVCYEMLRNENFYDMPQFEMSTEGLCLYLDKFANSLKCNYRHLYQFYKMLLGCKLIFQINKQNIQNQSLRLILQAFCKNFFDHFLFEFTEFRELIVHFIQKEFESLTKMILAGMLNSLSIMFQAYQKYYKIQQPIIQHDYKKVLQIDSFLDYYFMFDLLYLQFDRISSIEQFAVIVDYYRYQFKQPYPNKIMIEILQNTATAINVRQSEPIDPFDFITFDTENGNLIKSFKTFLISRYLYLYNYNLQFFLFNIFSENKNQLNDEQYVKRQIQYIEQNIINLNTASELQTLFLELMQETSKKCLPDFLLLVLATMDEQLFIKLFGIIIYKYHKQPQAINFMENLQQHLLNPNFNSNVLGILKFCWAQKNVSFQAFLNKVKWKYRNIGLALLRCGSYIESVYYLEKYLAQKQLLFKFDLKKLDQKKQEKLYNTLQYINQAKVYLNCSTNYEVIYPRLEFDFPLQQQTITQQDISVAELKMRKKQIPLDVEFYNFQELIIKNLYLNTLIPTNSDKIIISLISEISEYVAKKRSAQQIEDSIKYLKRAIANSIKSINLSKIIIQNLLEMSCILKRLESYWEGLRGREIRITFVSKFPQSYWLYLNTLIKHKSNNYKIINYREDYAKYLIKKYKYDEAILVCKKKQKHILCSIYYKMDLSYKAISLIGIDPITFVQCRGNFMTDNCDQKIKFLRYLIKDQQFYREKVLQTYNEIWNQKNQHPLSKYFENRTKLSKFCYHYAQELEVEYAYKCDCFSKQTCLKIMDLYLASVCNGDKYVQQSFPKIFRIWFLHQKKDLFSQKFDSYPIQPNKLQYCLELLITGVETFKQDRVASRSIAQALALLAQNYPCQMIWWLAPLNHFNQVSPHKILMYQDVLRLVQEKREKLENLEKQFQIILKICQQKPKSSQSGWATENVNSQLIKDYQSNPEKLIYPGIENLSQPFKQESLLVKMLFISPQIKIAPSKDKPKKIQVDCSDQSVRYLLLKNEVQDQKGDTRREQRIIQMLQFFNQLLEPLQLKYPLFASMSLNQMNQVIEWVIQTKTCRDAIKSQSIPAKNKQVYCYLEWKQLNEQDPKLPSYFFEQYPNPEEWYEAQQNFIKTMALWSAFQYLIGFGDRHCDNILIHENGELIHIDYECVFHKGKFLPIPEIVDFRLTKNFRYSLGYLREQGQFRKLFEEILAMFQKKKENIIAFLDPYIYDPLICKTSYDVIDLIKMKLSEIKIEKLIARNSNPDVLRQMYYGWAPYL